MWTEDRLLIGGAFVPAADGATFDDVNPATEQVIGVAADASTADMDAAIAAARSAFDDTTWSTDVALRVDLAQTLAMVAVAVLAAALASVLPGRRAAKASPTEALADI